MARRALLKAKPSAERAIEVLFPPVGSCLFCSSKLEDTDFRPICNGCSMRLLCWFVYERRAQGDFWYHIEDQVTGRIKAAGQEATGAAAIMRKGSIAAMAQISRAMATCVPPVRYIRTDGVYLFTEGLEASRAAALKALGKQLARSFACTYLGQAGKRGSNWQEEAIGRYGGGDMGPFASYPVLICESGSINEAAALLCSMRAREIIWADADGL